MTINKTVDIEADGAAALLRKGPEQQAEAGEHHNQPQLFTLPGGLRPQVDPRQYRQADNRRHNQRVNRPLLPEQHGNQQRRGDQQHQQPAPVW